MWTRLRDYFLTGLIIAAPVSVTIWVVWSVIDWVDGLVTPLIPPQYSPETYLRFTIPGFGLVVAVVLLTLLGFLAANLVGRSVVGAGERIVDRMPVVRALYRAVKQIVGTVLADRTKNFQNVGLIEWPRKGVWAMCLVVTEAKGQISQILGAEGEKVYACVVPPSPVPTAGALLYVRESDLIILDMTVEDGAKMIVSMGLVVPEYPRVLTAKPEKRRKKAQVAAGSPVPTHPGKQAVTPL